jgi:hypothetical protein
MPVAMAKTTIDLAEVCILMVVWLELGREGNEDVSEDTG